MSKIHIPTPLRQYVGKQSTVEVKGATVGEAMSDAAGRSIPICAAISIPTMASCAHSSICM